MLMGHWLLVAEGGVVAVCTSVLEAGGRVVAVYTSVLEAGGKVVTDLHCSRG